MAKSIYFETAADGILTDPVATQTQELSSLLLGLADAEPLAVVMHGGLVGRDYAVKIIEASLRPQFIGGGVNSIFFLWHSGFTEVMANNWREIPSDPFFTGLVRRILKFAASKLISPAAIKGPSDYKVSDKEVADEFEKLKGGVEPYAQLDPGKATQPTQEELDAFKKEMENDALMATHAQLAAAGAKPYKVDATKLDDLRTRPDGQKGPFALGAAIAAVKILARVCARFVNEHHHGVYPTIVEEIARELYLDGFGGMVWNTMKKETADTFARNAPQPRGGAKFLDELAVLLATGKRPRITLIGHSAGSVFANNLIAETARRRAAGEIPVDFAYSNVVYLAPACTVADFNAKVLAVPNLLRSFRMFTMTDEAECDDPLAKYLYPRSLLYLISGLLERDANGDSLSDCEILGMRRYQTRDTLYNSATYVAVRNYLGQHGRTAYSPSGGGAAVGFRTQAACHACFAWDGDTIASVVRVTQPPPPAAPRGDV